MTLVLVCKIVGRFRVEPGCILNNVRFLGSIVVNNHQILISFYIDIDIDIDACSPNPCRNDGTCTVVEDSFNCTCVAGYEGSNCTTSKHI